MATLHSFYLDSSAWQVPFRLAGDEAHHLRRVLRIMPGTTVRLFDGKGRHGIFTVRELSKSGVELSLASESSEPLPRVRCTLAAGFSKALRRGWFLEKAVELESVAVWFWQGEHSQASLPDVEKSAWRGPLIAGAKQCEAAWLPELAVVGGGAEGLAARRDEFDRAFLLYEGDVDGRMLTKEDLAEPGNILLTVGPEGGFSLKEVACLEKAGFVAASLGDRILRWETAAVLALGLAWWARQGT